MGARRKRLILFTGSFLLSIVLTSCCLGVGIYFAKHYYDSMYELFNSTTKPLVTEKPKDGCLVNNNQQDCIVKENDKTLFPSANFNVRYCHGLVSYKYDDVNYSNVTLDNFPQAYQTVNSNEGWVDFQKGDFNGTLDDKIRIPNNSYDCYVSPTHPSQFVAFEKRDIIYYYLNEMSNMLNTFSVIAIVLLVPAVFLCLTVVPVSFCCCVYQWRSWKKQKDNLGVEAHFEHQEMHGEESDEEITTNRKDNKYF
ncbi:hypothetical protein ABK040_016751 [Willaertia magna]